MLARGEVRLGMRMAAAFARFAADRVREYTGAALPRTVDQLARPEVVNALLRDHRPHTGTPLPAVRRVGLPGVQFESSNCTNFLIDVDFDTADDGAALPESLYVEMPCAEIATSAFANAVGFWEVMQWCKGIRDVQYFLTYSLDADALAVHEDELIDFYLERLASLGVVLDRGEAREQYRSFALQTLMVAVVSLGLGGLTERDDTVRAVLRRSVAAIDRLGVDDWLRHLR